MSVPHSYPGASNGTSFASLADARYQLFAIAPLQNY